MLPLVSGAAAFLLIVGVGIGSGDVVTKDNRSAGRTAIVGFKAPGSDAACRRSDRSKRCGRKVQPGQSWNAYYQSASCGGVIGVASGNHGNQAIIENSRLSRCARNVVFRAVPGAKVTMSKLTLGPVATATQQGADHVTIKGPMRITGGVACMGDCSNIVIDNVDGGTVSLYGYSASNAPSNWVIRNSDWGPCHSSGPFQQQGNCDTSAPDSGQLEVVGGVRNIQFLNNTIHDYELVTSGDHYECVRTDGGSNYVWRGNKFWGCEIYALSTTDWGGVNYIDNNWFGGSNGPSGGPVGEAITADPTIPGQIYVRFNSFSSQDGITSDAGRNHTGWHIIGNLIGVSPFLGHQCFPNAEYKYNIYTAGKCGDSTNAGNRRLRYVNGTRGPKMNYHLAPGRWRADNYVPGSQPGSRLATDFDGHARKTPRDAGADERRPRRN
jgi:hypothetical protein